MKLHCPRCRRLVGLPDRLNRYFGMPVACYHCAHVFAVPPQNPRRRGGHPGGHPGDHPGDHQGGPRAKLDHPQERSVSAERSHHARRCPACARQMRLPGSDPAIGPLNLSCPYCGVMISIPGGRELRFGFILAALGFGVGAGLLVLWMDHQGLIALDRLHITRWLTGLARDAHLFEKGWR